MSDDETAAEDKSKDERINDIRRQRMSDHQPRPNDLGAFESGVASGIDLFNSTDTTPSRKVKHVTPSSLLLCDECDEYYNESPEKWNHCPKCGTELREVHEA